VIAHEIGHLALGHVQAGVVWPQNVQRNQEREADSFASSTLSQAPFAEYLFIGHLATMFLLLQSQRRRGEDHKSTHPDPESRLHSAYLNNPSLAAEAEKRLGISLELLSRVWRRMVS
jgi:predicted Zn-dependent protease